MSRPQGRQRNPGRATYKDRSQYRNNTGVPLLLYDLLLDGLAVQQPQLRVCSLINVVEEVIALIYSNGKAPKNFLAEA